ncbi:AAA family ATPase [Candidatus Viridilinea mediisalina]|uniref:Chromosome partition protein Smc n=1 Tax=Candidatus Viridilinea mediisalina TaxID=2024553 RepID=A0A2A6RGQ7_9CHLR|nr:AAA family ATPase [Candidatus Viridilinea mediisalina]PDW02121.1 chromosome segregation protein SMC [Candidatus Viridilinea mediisalina]
MHLKRLEIQGFKTFATRTILEFRPGITAIVGPNGSGKSNVADAVRWVLGEQSFATLRCKRSEELIYAGGGRRAAAGLAEVSLTIDNSDRLLPLDFDEVTITRRATRSGESDYFINRARVRLRDLLEATEPLGGSYTIINQGLVDAALTLRPEERRRLFEDAAELGGFELRKAEATRRLRETDTNLSRVADLLAELEPRLRSLKRQASQARQQRELTEEVCQLQTQSYGLLWREAEALTARTAGELARCETQLHQARATQTAVSSELTALRSTLRARREQLGALHQQARDLQQRAEAAQRDLAVSNERTAALGKRLEDLERQRNDLALRHNQAEAQRSSAAAELAQAEAQLLERRQALQQAQTQQTSLEAARQTLRQSLQQAQAAALKAATSAAEQQTRNEQLAAQAARLKHEADELAATLAQATQRLNAAQAQHAEAEAHVAAIEAAQQQTISAEQAARQQLDELRSARSQADESLAAARRRLADLEARYESLERLARSYAGTFAGVRAAMQWAERTQRPGFALVQAIIRTPANIETAIEVALGSRLQNIVVERWADAEDAIAELKRSGAGRATFMPLDTLRSGGDARGRGGEEAGTRGREEPRTRGREEPGTRGHEDAASPPASSPLASSPLASSPLASSPLASSPLASSPLASSPPASSPLASSPLASSPLASSPLASSPPASSPPASSPPASSPLASSPLASSPLASSPPATATLGIAADLVGYEQRYAPVVRQLLGRVIVVRDLPTARRELRQLSGGWTLVTLAGEQVNSGGSLTGGAQVKESGVLRRERELRELPEQITAARATVEATAAQRDELERQLQRHTSQLRELEGQVREGRRRLESARSGLDTATRRVSQVQQEQQWAKERSERIAQDQQALQSQRAALATALNAAQALVQRSEAELAELRQRQEAEAHADRVAQVELSNLRAAVGSAEGQLRAGRSLVQAHTASLALLEQEAQQLTQAQTQVQTERAALLAAHTRAEALHSKLIGELEQLRERIAPSERVLQSDEAQQSALEAREEAATAALLAAESAQSRAALEAQRANDRQEALLERAASDGIDVLAPTEIPADAQVQTLQNAIEALKAKILRLGAVNPLALEEYEENAKRQAFLSGQVDDLRAASTTLMELIGELDTAMQSRFLSTFSAVASAFEQSFTQLFGGGTAKLLLTSSSNNGSEAPSSPSKQPGIEIIARPPGKKQQNIALLSGGERSLTAAALLFAILKVNPSPFCILDETDAALDESNVGRFRDALRQLTSQTQCLLITHNRGTIEAADTLYGVTMGDDGASKVMSLRVEAYVAEAI